MSIGSHPAALYQLRKVTRILALIILLLAVFGFVLPTDYRVERSVSIDASVDTVYEKMLQGSVLSKWMYVQDGYIEMFEGSLEVGGTANLVYGTSSELGSITLIEKSNRLVSFDVRPKPSMNLVHNQIVLKNDEGMTLVKWTIEGDLSAGLLSPYIALFANNIAGKNFEISLQRLKQQIEVQY